MRLYEVRALAENGLNCDCCVIVSEVTAFVFAKNKKDVKKLVKAYDSDAVVQIVEFITKGKPSDVKLEGVMLVSSKEIYKGHPSESPLF